MTDEQPLEESTRGEPAETLDTSTASAEAVADPVGEPSDPADDSSTTASRRRRSRASRNFPACSFNEALPIAQAIQRFAAGQRIRRLTLFENLNRSPDSGGSRMMVTNSAQYGLTKGSYSSEYLELTDTGRLASAGDDTSRTVLAAKLQLAIAEVVPFKAMYDQYQQNRLPALTVLKDFTLENGTPPDRADECVETFLVNARELKLIRNYAGAERLLSFEMLLEGMDNAPVENLRGNDQETHDENHDGPSYKAAPMAGGASPGRVLVEATDLSDVCFLISPIGSEGSEHRKHANLVLGSLLEPALEGLGLRLVRADRISKPGMITAQIIQHIVQSPLVIADLSFGNPNVFYELALRHASQKPVVQLVRSSDPLPFDVGQFRTVALDMTDIYTLVPQIDSYRAEIARQCRAALEETGPSDSPLSLFYPAFWEQFHLMTEL